MGRLCSTQQEDSVRSKILALRCHLSVCYFNRHYLPLLPEMTRLVSEYTIGSVICVGYACCHLQPDSVCAFLTCPLSLLWTSFWLWELLQIMRFAETCASHVGPSIAAHQPPLKQNRLRRGMTATKAKLLYQISTRPSRVRALLRQRWRYASTPPLRPLRRCRSSGAAESIPGSTRDAPASA